MTTTVVTRAQATIKLNMRRGGNIKTVTFDVDVPCESMALDGVPAALSESVSQMLAFLAADNKPVAVPPVVVPVAPAVVVPPVPALPSAPAPVEPLSQEAKRSKRKF